MAPVRAPAVPGSRQKTSEQGEDTRLSPPRAGPDRRQPRSALVPCPRAPGHTAAHATDVTGARNAARNGGPLLPSGAQVPVGGRRRQGPGSAGGRGARGAGLRRPCPLGSHCYATATAGLGRRAGRVCFPRCGNHCVTGAWGAGVTRQSHGAEVGTQRVETPGLHQLLEPGKAKHRRASSCSWVRDPGCGAVPEQGASGQQGSPAPRVCSPGASAPPRPRLGPSGTGFS